MAKINPTAAKRGPGRPRKKAPEVNIVDEVYKDMRAATVSIAKQELGEQAEGMAFCFRSVNEHPDVTRSLGYVPCMKPAIEGEATEQYTHGGDPLFMRPQEVSDMHRNAPAELAKQQLEDAYYGEGDYDGITRE